MLDILALLQCLDTELEMTSIRRLSRIIQAMLAMSGRVTMLGIARWAERGGSYRTVQRFFSTAIPWASLLWVFFRQHCYSARETYILAGDEVVVTKAGKQTYGLDRFFSSLYDHSVPGLAFFGFSLVGVKERHSYLVSVEQVVRTESEKADIQAAKAAQAAKVKTKASGQPRSLGGRPKGKKTTPKTEVSLTPELHRIQGWLASLLARLTGYLSVSYVVLDGHFGNHNALAMVRSQGLHLISKLRHDAALYLPYQGANPRRKYGDKLNYQNLPSNLLQSSTTAQHPTRLIQTNCYHATLLHEQFAHPLNVVILQSINLHTQAQTRVILFSSDLSLSPELLVDYYRLRFQIEFNFRDAKQFWGLEDFMTIQPTTVTNAACLSLLMPNLSHVLLKHFRQGDPHASLLDLKAYARGYRYAAEIINLLPKKPEPGFWHDVLNRLTRLGRIHPLETLPDSA